MPFIETSGNLNFRISLLTWANLFILLIVYPGISLIGTGEDPLKYLTNVSQPILIIMLLATVLMQWTIFAGNLFGTMRERTGLRGLGLGEWRWIWVLYAIAFLLVANLILSGVAWILAQLGHPMPGELGMLIPEGAAGKLVWVVVAFTAGFCEEIAFRGYLMTRLRLIFKFQSMVIPTIVSALAFGICHMYQGLPGLVVITIYGAMFSVLYLRTGSLWPCIIAHVLQDAGALFFPR